MSTARSKRSDAGMYDSLLAAVVIVVGMMLPGCGGSHPGSTVGGPLNVARGAMAVSVQFPTPTRQSRVWQSSSLQSGGRQADTPLPAGTQGIKVAVLDPVSGNLLVPIVLLTPPAEGGTVTTTITGIRSGPVLIRGTAYIDATLDQPLALAEANGVVVPGQIGRVSVPFVFGVVTTLAGGADANESDGLGGQATFDNPANLTVDRSTGDTYVCDFAEDLPNSTIRKVTPAGVVTTLVNQANFTRPFGIATTPNGELYVETDRDDQGNSGAQFGAVWHINRATGVATIVARDIGRPRGLAGLPDGRLVLSDLLAHTIRLMNPNTGAITPLAGAANSPGYADGKGAAARFNRPYGVAIMPDGSILVADQNNSRLRRVTLDGTVTTFAGNGTPGLFDGDKNLAEFKTPQAVAVDSLGVVYVSDNGNNRIRRIGVNGFVTTIAGNNIMGFADGTGLQASFFGQEGIALSPDGRILYVADNSQGASVPFNRIRKITLP